MSDVLNIVSGRAMFNCPGCRDIHQINISGPPHPAWTWNGSTTAPTFTPSILATSGHYTSTHRQGEDSCWCTYNREHPDEPSGFSCYRCHSFVTDGRIAFLSDCTHALAGQTVDLPPWEDS